MEEEDSEGIIRECFKELRRQHPPSFYRACASKPWVFAEFGMVPGVSFTDKKAKGTLLACTFLLENWFGAGVLECRPDILQFVIERSDVNAPCYADTSTGRTFDDALSLCIYQTRSVAPLVQYGHPTFETLLRAKMWCERMFEVFSAPRVYHISKHQQKLQEREDACLRITQNNFETINALIRRIYAVFWAFRQSFPGDHSALFAVFEGVWRETGHF
jgi:hypothetical protein